MSQEQWKPIKEYQGHSFTGEWQVSSWGNVRHKDGRTMSYYSDNRGQGYMRFKLYDCNGNRVAIKVHRLVALYFIPTDNKKLEINHKDGNPKNNSFTNLEWVTHKENVQKYRMQYKKIKKGSQPELSLGEAKQ